LRSPTGKQRRRAPTGRSHPREPGCPRTASPARAAEVAPGGRRNASR
jgi:hypothetical protein